jgi:predicted  nucleic acid-binding Zn-ribbon protein
MNIVGPSRLILLRSGKYDYGEIELINPLHLIGPNNVGKTSLIAVLQLLYIDDQRSMHFSREMSETRKYYFPDQNSYILFECLTQTGYQVVGVQGLGPIRGYEFQRFTYQGMYDPVDYLDDARCIRPSDEIRSHLAAREFRLLEPRHLRAALTGLGENRGVNLGLVPIRQRDHYERFRAVFGNLLRLAHLRQNELKEFLLEIHQGEFQQRAIDLEMGYSTQYSKVCREAKELLELRTIADDVQRVLELAATRDSLRRLLPGLWQEITRSFALKEDEFSKQGKKINDHLEQIRDEKQSTIEEIERSEEEQQKINQSIGKIEGAIEKHLEEANEFQNYLVDFEKSRCSLLETKIEHLGASLGQVSDISLPQMQAIISKMKAELAGLEKQRDHFSRIAAARILPMLPEEDLQNAFRLINPAILGLIQGEDAIELQSVPKIKAFLDHVTGHIQAGVYQDDRIRLVLSSLNPPDLSPYRDADILATRIAEHKKVLARELQLYDAAKNAEPVKREKQKLMEEWKEVNSRLIRFEKYQKEIPEYEKNKESQSTLNAQLKELKVKIKQFKDRQSSLRDEERSRTQALKTIETKRDALVQRIRKLTRPDSSWPLEPFSHEGRDLEALLELYEQQSREQSDISQRFNEFFYGVNQRTYDKYVGEDEAATIANLRAEIEAIEERENAVQELWKSLIAGLQSSFKGLNRDLQTLISRIDELNRRLGKISISNLARLRLILREHPEWTKRIKTMVDAEISPLFADQAAVSEAHIQLGDLLKKHQRVELADLFDLHFEVTSVDGQIRRYPHLDSIESNGTTITIKVLINLLLLKGLLGDKEVTIPFYLDEASSLDRENLTAIVDEARKMGFVAVLASPEAMEAADSLYFLREKNGRIMLDPKTSLVRIERKNADGG